MAETSTIEWTDATWNPVTGCSVVSPGCKHCYAMGLAGGRLQHHPSRAGLTIDTPAGPVWNGQVRFNAEWLTQPLRWSRPRKIFVCAHGDLFHDNVPDVWIDQVIAVMALAPQHTFQVLTKRAARMRAYMTTPDRKRTIAATVMEISMLRGREAGHRAMIELDHFSACFRGDGPFPNVWLGVSAEDQPRADERIPELLATPAAVRGVSLEPLLGPIALTRIGERLTGRHSYAPETVHLDSLRGERVRFDGGSPIAPVILGEGLDWVIVGGESGPKARPMHPDWARRIRDDCAAAGVPFFFKQWGSWEPREEWSAALRLPMLAIDRTGAAVPDDVAPQDVGGQRFAWVGKKAAGRLLDGVTHDAMPLERRS